MFTTLLTSKCTNIEIEILLMALKTYCEIVTHFATYFARLTCQPRKGNIKCTLRTYSITIEIIIVKRTSLKT